MQHSQNLMPERLVYGSDGWKIIYQVEFNVAQKLHHMLQQKFADKVICRVLQAMQPMLCNGTVIIISTFCVITDVIMRNKY